MTEENQTEKHETLGEYLVQQRKEKDLKIEDILEETKIPPKTLKAMEADDYGQLPADAFARGFYMLYAKYLALDPNDILERFDRERTQKPGRGRFTSPTKQVKHVNTMAARPSMVTGSLLGLNLVIIIGAIALICWYFSWNPATYISEKLRSFQEPTSTALQVDNTAQIVSATEDTKESNHFLTLDFLEDTTITISIDNGLPEKEAYSQGSTRSWYATSSISLILPESAAVELFFNGSKLELPQPQGGLITIDLP